MKGEFSKFRSAFWQIDYPSDWIIEKHHECDSFYAENGFGVLQISAYLKNEEITQKDLDELITDEIPIDTKLNEFAAGKFTGLATEFSCENHFWRIWILQKNKVLLYITYNCEFKDRRLEEKTVNRIIKTLKDLD